MPTESPAAPLPGSGGNGAGPSLPSPSSLKCTWCGAASSGQADGIIFLGQQMERVCATCMRTDQLELGAITTGLGLDLAGSSNLVASSASAFDFSRLRDAIRARGAASESKNEDGTAPAASAASPASPQEPTPSASVTPLVIPGAARAPASPTEEAAAESPTLHSKSLPPARTAPWATATSTRNAPALAPAIAPMTPAKRDSVKERASNPLLEVGSRGVPSTARGCLYPGSIFRGTQSSGRNSYDVQIQIADVNLNEYTLCGYLTIWKLTDAHPELTTYFDAEIIGPKYGFVTGPRYGAKEHDDMRHWGRFEEFRRPATRADIVRPEQFLRDPLPDTSSGEIRPKEREFVFLRIKEKFLVPNHHDRDISGASFAGFYYAMVDLSPTLEPAAPTSPLLKSPRSPGRRLSSGGVRPDAPRRPSISERRQSQSGARPDAPRRQSSRAPATQDATLRGYYFHCLNHEPFQELSLVHVPTSSAGTFELR